MITKSMYNADSVSILVKNMPVDDDELCGRIRDHLALVLKGCEAQCASIINKINEKECRNNAVQEVLDAVFSDMGELEMLFSNYSSNVEESYEDFRLEFEETIAVAGIDEKHSAVLLESLGKLLDVVRNLSESKDGVNAAIVSISSTVKSLRE